MANDKKFIVKNGLLTPQNVVIGSNSDTGENLQVTGTSKLSGNVQITQSTAETPSIDVHNSGGYLSEAIVARFRGDSDSLQIINTGIGDYKLVNSQQNNGIIFYDSTPGVRILYNNAARLDINSAGNRFYGLSTTTIDNNRILTTADEGSGNGLDADTVDGLDSLQFVRADVDDIMAGNYTIQQDLVVSGNLTVSGTTTTINTEEILLADNIITLNSNYTGSTPTENAGIEIERGTLNNPKILWDETSDYWKLISGNLTDLGRIITTADEGSGNGFDADTVDGLQASQFLRSDVDDTAAGNITIQGDLTLGDNVGGAQINFDGVGNNRTLYSESGVIGFLNQAFNYAARSTADGDWIVERDVKADRNLIAQTNITATTGDITATAGDVIAGDSITAQNNITATTGNIAASAGSVSAATTVTAGTDVIGQRFVDADNNSYVVDPAGTSTMNDIGIDDDLFHNGDTDTKLSFDTDDISLQTGGVERLGIDNDSVDSTVTFTAPSVGIDTDLFHNGDTDTKIAFTTDELKINTGGATRLTANTTGIHVTNLTASGNISAAIEVESPVYYDKDDRTYYGDFASTSRINDISLVGEIIADGDTNTFIDFNAADSLQITTGGTVRFTLDNTNLTVSHQIRSPIYYDNDDLNYYGNFASTSRLNNISLVGEIIHDGDTNTYIHFNAADSFQVVAGGANIFTATSTTVTVDGDLTVTGTINGDIANFTGDVSANNITATTAIYSPIYYDADNNAYYGDFAGTSVFNRISIDDYVVHNGDADTYVGFSAADTFDVVTAGTTRLTVDTTYVTSTLDGIFPNLFAFRYYDAENATFYTEPAATSRINDISLVGEIIHDGDTNTYLEFNAADSFRVVTGGAQRLLVNNSYVLADNQMRSPIFYDSNNTAYYGDFASTSNMSRIDIDDYIRHRGDLDTYMGFDVADTWGVWTNGVRRLTSNATAFTSGLEVRAPRFVDSNDINYYVDPANASLSATLNGAVRIGSIANNARYSDNTDNGGIALLSYGDDTATSNPSIAVSGNYAGAYALLYLNRIDPNPNPFNGGNRYIEFRHDGTAGGTIRGDASGNLYQILAAGTNWGFWTSASSEALIVDDNGDVMIAAGASPTYTDGGDNTPLVGTNNPAKLHIGGSIYLNNNDDAIIFGRGTGSFLKDEELAFGWGSGWYMTDATYLRVRNNTSVYSTGDYYGSRFYATAATAYYLDPDGDSQLNTIDIDDYVRHRGDTNTYVGFPSNDRIYLATNGVARVDITNSIVTANNPVKINAGFTALDIQKTTNGSGVSIRMTDQSGTATQFGSIEYYHVDNVITSGAGAAFLFRSTEPVTHFVFGSDSDGAGTTAANRPELLPQGNNTGYIGNTNYRWQYVYANTGNFSGDFTAANMYASRYYDADNNAYYGDFASTSIMRQIQFDQSSVQAPTATDATTGARLILYPLGSGRDYAIGIESDHMWFNSDGGFKWYTDGAIRAVLNDDYFFHNSDIRAPIFYDLNNTAYYVDPASNTRLNTIQALRYYFNHNTTYYMDQASGTYGSVKTGGATGGWSGYAIEDWWVFMADSASNAGIYNDTDNKWAILARRNAEVELYYNDVVQAETQSGYFLANNQMRSPIFYDSNNTAYFVNPDSTTNIRYLKVNTTGTSSGTRALTIKSDGQGETNFGAYPASWTSALQIQNNNNTDMIWISPLDDGYSGRFRMAGAGLDFYTDGTVADVGTHSAFIGSGYIQGISSIRGPIFYDSNDTNYYVDPNNISHIRHLEVAAVTNAAGYSDAAIEVREFNYGGAQADTYAIAPRIGFHWGGRVASQIALASNGEIRILNNPGTATENFRASIGYFDASARAPIFYDLNDTAYYGDFASESRINTLRTAGRVVIGGTFENNAYISVASTRLHFGGGDSDANLNYYIGTNLENYGGNYTKLDLRWHTGIRMGAQPGYGGVRIYNNEDLGSVLFSVGKGDTHVRVENGNNLYVEGGDARATIFYDYNDTNYYANPNGTTRFYEQRNVYRLHIGNETDLYNGILAGRADLTIRDPYPQLNIMSTQISNTTHGGTLRFAAYDTANASSGNFKHWVIGIAGTNATSLHFGYSPNQTNPHYGIGRGWSSGNNVSMFWLQNDRNVYAENDVRALRFVDRDSTGYYMDPSNLSELYDVRQRGHYTRTYAHSGSDFVDGTLVITSIPATATNGASFVLEASGKSYSGDPPFKFTAQGYLYADTIINYSGQNIGKAGFATMYVFQYNGVLCFWWPRVSYWNSFAVHVRDAGGDDRNLVTSITNSVIPGGRTKEVQVPMRTTAIYNVNLNTGDMYASRYYDSNNTGYYGDFASTSRMNTIDVDRINFVGGAPAYFYTSTGALRGYIRATETNDSHFEFATSGGEDIIFRDGGFGGSYNQIIRGDGQVLISSRLDVPIMYDLNDTGYYVDPAATTQLSYVLANNWFRAQGSTGFYFESYGKGMWSPEAGGNSYGNVTTYGGGRNGWQGWGIGSRHVFMSTGGDNVGIHDNSRGWIYYWNGSYNEFTYGYTIMRGSARAPIFYDLDNTAYYVNPASNTYLYGNFQVNGSHGDSQIGVRLLSGNNGAGTGEVNLRMWTSEPGVTWDSAGFGYNVTNNGGAPNGFGRINGAHGQAYMRFDTGGNLYFYNTNTGGTRYTNMELYSNNTVYFNNYATGGNSLRAPIFYDSNNTGYFADPAGRSRLSSMDYGNGGFYLAGGDWGYRHNTPYGWIQFGPANTSHAHIYTDRGNFYFNVNEMYMNGRFVLNENWWINNKYFGSGGEIYGTIFYDSNNSAYYYDGASDNSTRMRGVSNETMAFMQLPGHTRSSKEYYAARPRITGDTNYWTGAVGWGTVDMNTVAHWGSGFFDTWGNPANQPAGTSHWVGVQAYHYSNGGAQNGWQMAGGPISGLWFRNSWAGFSSWRKIVMYGLNEYSTDLWASILYDSNDSGYYCDPNGTNRFNNVDTNSIYTRDWFRNYNSGQGLYNQSTRMHIYSTNGYIKHAGGGYGYGGIAHYNNYESDIRGTSGYFDSSGFGMLNSSGNWQIRIEYGNANMELYRVTNGNDIRAYIFYDRNDTGYYVDPNGTSNLGRFTNRTHAAMNRGHHWITPRFDYTGDSNYWTGTFGWGTSAGTWANAWKAGFAGWDIWGTGTDHPQGAGYIHAQGIVSGQHYATSDGGAAYGWMMVGATNATENRYWARGKWGGGTSGWKEFAMYGGGGSGSLYANIFYDSDNAGYYVDPASTSNLNVLNHEGEYGRWWEPKGVGGDSGNGAHAYRIFQEGGGWGYPFPDLRIAYHVGIKMGANASYEGIRIYDDYTMSTIRWQFNGGSGYQYQYTWTNLTGYHGLYSSLNSAHIYPNNGSYGSWKIDGQRNGWGGIEFSYANTSLMMNSDTYGFYNYSSGWRFYNQGGSGYFPGNVVAYWSDRRLKENIEELERGTGLDLIYKLKPSKFNWKKEATEVTGGVIEAGKEEVSIIAQEAQEVLYDAVVINKTGKKGVVIDGEEINDYLTINYDKITPFLIQAIKDLKDEIDDLKQEMKTLKEENK